MLICAEQASCCQFSGDYYGRVESLKTFIVLSRTPSFVCKHNFSADVQVGLNYSSCSIFPSHIRC